MEEGSKEERRCCEEVVWACVRKEWAWTLGCNVEGEGGDGGNREDGGRCGRRERVWTLGCSVEGEGRGRRWRELRRWRE